MPAPGSGGSTCLVQTRESWQGQRSSGGALWQCRPRCPGAAASASDGACCNRGAGPSAFESHAGTDRLCQRPTRERAARAMKSGTSDSWICEIGCVLRNVRCRADRERVRGAAASRLCLPGDPAPALHSLGRSFERRASSAASGCGYPIVERRPGACAYGTQTCDCSSADKWACWNPADCPASARASASACTGERNALPVRRRPSAARAAGSRRASAATCGMNDADAGL